MYQKNLKASFTKYALSICLLSPTLPPLETQSTFPSSSKFSKILLFFVEDTTQKLEFKATSMCTHSLGVIHVYVIYMLIHFCFSFVNLSFVTWFVSTKNLCGGWELKGKLFCLFFTFISYCPLLIPHGHHGTSAVSLLFSLNTSAQVASSPLSALRWNTIFFVGSSLVALSKFQLPMTLFSLALFFFPSHHLTYYIYLPI